MYMIKILIENVVRKKIRSLLMQTYAILWQNKSDISALIRYIDDREVAYFFYLLLTFFGPPCKLTVCNSRWIVRFAISKVVVKKICIGAVVLQAGVSESTTDMPCTPAQRNIVPVVIIIIIIYLLENDI